MERSHRGWLRNLFSSKYYVLIHNLDYLLVNNRCNDKGAETARQQSIKPSHPTHCLFVTYLGVVGVSITACYYQQNTFISYECAESFEESRTQQYTKTAGNSSKITAKSNIEIEFSFLCFEKQVYLWKMFYMNFKEWLQAGPKKIWRCRRR